jgi:hypothetical protein
LNTLSNEINDNITYYSVRKDFNDSFNEKSYTMREEYEPTSIKQLNNNLTENSNKIQKYQNDIQAKNNLIAVKIKQVEEDKNFLIEVEKEKNGYVDNMSDDIINELSRGTKPYQIKLIKFAFENILNNLSSNCDTILTPETEVESKYDNTQQEGEISDRTKIKIFTDFRKEVLTKFGDFKFKLKSSNTLLNYIGVDKLRELNKKLESLKLEAEFSGKDEIYEKFYYPLFKYIKLIIFMTLGYIRINKLKDAIEKVNFL